MVHVDKLFYSKVNQFSMCSDPDRFTKFSRKGVLISNGGGKILLILIDGGLSIRNIRVNCYFHSKVYTTLLSLHENLLDGLKKMVYRNSVLSSALVVFSCFQNFLSMA